MKIHIRVLTMLAALACATCAAVGCFTINLEIPGGASGAGATGTSSSSTVEGLDGGAGGGTAGDAGPDASDDPGVDAGKAADGCTRYPDPGCMEAADWSPCGAGGADVCVAGFCCEPIHCLDTVMLQPTPCPATCAVTGEGVPCVTCYPGSECSCYAADGGAMTCPYEDL